MNRGSTLIPSVSPSQTPLRRRGFTILELLVVVSIMAIISTFATGAAIKAVKQSRIKRIDATVKALEMALVNYHAEKGEWPFELSELEVDADDYTDTKDKFKKHWVHGTDNYKVFKKLYVGTSGAGGTVFLDASALLTEVNGARSTLKKALKDNEMEAPLGYPLPDDSNQFCFFCVCFNPITDSVDVMRQDQPHWRTDESGNKKEFGCPKRKKK